MNDAVAVFSPSGAQTTSRLSDADFLAFAIPLGLCFEIQSIGEIFPGDLLVLITFGLLLLSGRIRIPEPAARTTLALFAIWFLGQAVTDAVRRTPVDDVARGWAMIILSAISFLTIYVLIGDSTRRVLLFAAGIAAGIAIRYLVEPGAFALDYPWKFGYGLAVTLVMVLCAVAAHRRTAVSSAILLLAGATNLVEGYRSLALVCVAAAAIILGRQLRHAAPQLGTVIPLVLLLAVSLGLAHVYDYLAGSGTFGLKAQQKFERESPGEFGIILGGRPDLMSALLAIRDSPLIGHGSWARDPNYQYTMSADAILLSLGYSIYPPIPENNPVLPSHSHILGAWVDAGILGALFWAWIASLAGRAILATYRSNEACAALFAFLVCSLLWDLCFSPYGAERRIITPYYIVAAIVIIRRAERLRAFAS